MITMTVFEIDSFDMLVGLFDPIYKEYTPHSVDGLIKRKDPNFRSGRKRFMYGKDCLGLCLTWTRTRG